MSEMDTGSGQERRGYVVGPARPTDGEALGLVHVRVWREAYTGLMPRSYLDGLDARRSAARWADILATPDARVLVGTHQGEVVGFVGAGPARDDDPASPVELWALNVLADHQGTGLADTLVDAALAGSGAYLWVLAGNVRAQAFYRRHGFRADGGSKVHAPTGLTEVRMLRAGA